MSSQTTSSPAPSADPVRLEILDGVATLRVDRPPMNALNQQTQRLLGEFATEIAERRDIAAVVLTGGPDVFAAGADIKEMEHLDHADMVRHSGRLQAAFSAIARIPQPVVAAVHGYALGGGCELALCADVRFAAEGATFGQPEIKLGIIPGAGGTQRLTRLIGPSRSKELILSGRFVPADEALALGLADRVLPAAELDDAAYAWARQFVGGPALALRAAKTAIDRGATVDLETGLEIERQQFAGLFGTADQQSGMAAFTARTQPEFTGR
ncbi:MAG: enoyl-CoA hydratase/isomerase family protein [Propionibacteriaceae bacterium]